ncbi:DUF397 domain-containing protein [Kineosporia sp. NBRC 101731]|uniref:DUF397 domain-containing protein n=1 Tax=Kineosporia sp. NBRC 101731 TaxID=3032199 RepID=UPI0024A24BEC|nr:DUF397 domain-containing protein [Kineosporia sp. NBRC 101731]GLY29846.1 hypothetical protein Kisp02_32110 [Kineosporia sp. NBRC 101731]
MSDTAWHKARASDTGDQCVEVRRQGMQVQVRDTKNAGDGILTFSPDEWRAFITGVKAGEFDREGQ